MKTHKKMFITAAAAALCLAAAVPAAVYGAEASNPSAADAAENTDSTFDDLPGGIADDNGGFVSEWVTDADGRIFYYDEKGTMVTGEQEIEEELYLFSKNGVLKTGWRTVGGKRRYYDPKTGKPIYGKLIICGEEFYIESEQGKLSDSIFTDDNGDMYITDEKGAVILEEGFIEKDGAFYYVTSSGKLAVGEIVIDGSPYVFDENGAEQTGWVIAVGKEYYYNSQNGEIQFGLINVDGSIYYVDNADGKKEGIVEIDGVEYLFAEGSGQLQTGLVEINGNLKYFYNDGKFAVGVTEVNDAVYLFSDKGTMLNGLQVFNGKTYYAEESGVLCKGLINVGEDFYFFGDDFSAQEGLVKVDNDRYLFGEDGKMAKGLNTFNGKSYYLDAETGKMMTGKLLLNGKRYYFSSEDGSMQTGWAELDGEKYYFGEDGIAVTGINEIDGNKYFFHNDTAVMMSGRLIIDGKKYYFGEDGAMVFGWATFDEGKYFFGDDGVMVTGWKTIGGKKYYFNTSSGVMETNKIVGDYNLESDGHAVALSAVQKRAKEIIASTGKSATAIYNYVCNNNKYRFIEETRTLAQIESKGWSYFANYALDNRFVVCYYFAAVTDLLFKQAGYQTRIVYGTGRGTGDHYWNQIYDEDSGKWVNYDTCNGYRAVTFAYLQTQNYTFYQYVYPKYY